MKTVSKMEPKWGLVGPTFQKKRESEKVCLDCAGAYGLHVSPSLKAPDATNKSQKKHMCFKYAIFHQKYKNVWKMTSHMCPNGWLYFGGGASWGTLGAIIRNMYPKVLQKWSQDCKNASKKAPKMVKVSPKYWRILENDTSGPADCAKRLQ